MGIPLSLGLVRVLPAVVVFRLVMVVAPPIPNFFYEPGSSIGLSEIGENLLHCRRLRREQNGASGSMPAQRRAGRAGRMAADSLRSQGANRAAGPAVWQWCRTQPHEDQSFRTACYVPWQLEDAHSR